MRRLVVSRVQKSVTNFQDRELAGVVLSPTGREDWRPHYASGLPAAGDDVARIEPEDTTWVRLKRDSTRVRLKADATGGARSSRARS